MKINKEDWAIGSGLIAIAFLLERFAPGNVKIIDFITGVLMGSGLLLILTSHSKLKLQLKRMKAYLKISNK